MFSLSMRRRPRPHRKLEYWGIVFTLTLSLAATAAWARTLRSCLDGRLRIPMLVPLLLVTTGLALLALPHIDAALVLDGGGARVVAGTVAVQVTIDLSVRRLPLVPSPTATAVFFLSLLASDTDRIAGALGGLITMTLVAGCFAGSAVGSLDAAMVLLAAPWCRDRLARPWAIATAWLLTATSAGASPASACVSGAGARFRRAVRPVHGARVGGGHGPDAGEQLVSARRGVRAPRSVSTV